MWATFALVASLSPWEQEVSVSCATCQVSTELIRTYYYQPLKFDSLLWVTLLTCVSSTLPFCCVGAKTPIHKRTKLCLTLHGKIHPCNHDTFHAFPTHEHTLHMDKIVSSNCLACNQLPYGILTQSQSIGHVRRKCVACAALSGYTLCPRCPSTCKVSCSW